MSGFDFTFTSIDGAPLPLAQYRGRPLLVVNTASFCGFTPQYRDLEALWQRYRERGLMVIAVPSNDFGQQEPGSAAEIKQFCESRYAVDFPLAGKVAVIGPDGALAGAWPSSVRPTDPALAGEIERLLPAAQGG